MTTPTDNEALIDDLVADIIDAAGKHMKVAEDTIRKLTDDQRLLDRYGNFNLGITFGSKVVRRDVFKALQAKGMSVRQIAAATGASPMTVSRATTPTPKPVAVPVGTPAVLTAVPVGTPADDEEAEVVLVTEDEDDEATTAPAVIAPPAPLPTERAEVTALIRSVTKRPRKPLTPYEESRLRGILTLQP